MAEKIRLLQIIPTLDRSGAEKQLVLLAAHLPRERFEVRVAVLTRSGPLADELDAANISWTLIGKRGKIDPFAYWRLLREIRTWQPDIVHTWLFAANAYGRAAAMQAGVSRIVAAERCVDPWKRRWQHAIDQFFAPKTTRFVTNSRGVCDFYAQYNLPHERFLIIPNAVIESSAKPIEREVLLRQLGIIPLSPERLYVPVNDHISAPPPLMIIGVVARLWEQKRIADLFWLAELANCSQADIHFVVLGDGPQREELLRERDERRLFRNVHFLGQRNDVASFLPCFDLLLSTSAYEGQPNSLLEGMAAARAVLATNITGHAEIITHGETGYLVPELRDNAARRRGLGAAMLQLYENADLRTQLGNDAQKSVREKFSLASMIDAYSQFYDELMLKS